MVLKWFYSLSRRKTFVGGKCALPCALLVLIVFSMLDRSIQSMTETLPLKRGGVLHTVVTAPSAFVDMRLVTHLFYFIHLLPL